MSLSPPVSVLKNKQKNYELLQTLITFYESRAKNRKLTPKDRPPCPLGQKRKGPHGLEVCNKILDGKPQWTAAFTLNA